MYNWARLQIVTTLSDTELLRMTGNSYFRYGKSVDRKVRYCKDRGEGNLSQDHVRKDAAAVVVECYNIDEETRQLSFLIISEIICLEVKRKCISQTKCQELRLNGKLQIVKVVNTPIHTTSKWTTNYMLCVGLCSMQTLILKL